MTEVELTTPEVIRSFKERDLPKKVESLIIMLSKRNLPPKKYENYLASLEKIKEEGTYANDIDPGDLNL